MWVLEPMQKVLLIAVSSAVLGAGAIILIILAISYRYRGSKEKERAVMNGLVYGTTGKTGVNLKHFQQQEGYKNDLGEGKETQNGYQGVYGGNNSESSCTKPPSVSRQESTYSGKLSITGSTYSGKSSASRQDSTYSSMSSGQTSPSSVRSEYRTSTASIGSIPEQMTPPQNTVLQKSCTAALPACSSITVSLLLTNLKHENSDSSSVAAKLALSVESVSDLPSREYKAHCDPWVGITVLRDRRSLRRRPPAHLAYFRTKTIRHAHNPFYSQTFVADLQKNEIKDVSVRFTVMDQDRHTGPTELGRATVSLKEAKQTVQDPERSTLTLFLTQQKKENGEIQFGLSYLPTAQRLSINLGKASNLRFDKEDQQNNNKKPNPYVKLFFFNQSGRLVKKKKSVIKYDTKEPFFDETIHFEAEPGQLENHTVLVVLLSKQEQEEDLDDVGEGMIGLDLDSSDAESYYRFNLSSAERGRKASSSGKQKDSVLGVLCLGKHVRGDKEREQWNKMMDSPRKVFTVLHSFK